MLRDASRCLILAEGHDTRPSVVRTCVNKPLLVVDDGQIARASRRNGVQLHGLGLFLATTPPCKLPLQYC